GRAVPVRLHGCHRADPHVSLRGDQRLPARAPGEPRRRRGDGGVLRWPQLRRQDHLSDHREHRAPGQCLPARDGLCAVQPDRGRGQAALHVRRSRPRRGPGRAPVNRRPVLRATPPVRQVGGMGERPRDFEDYWQATLDELASYPACPEMNAIALRSTDFATLYGVRLTSLGPYRLFGYLSIPTGHGPFPAIYYAPKYQSVLEIIPQGTANRQRSRYITFSLAARGP